MAADTLDRAPRRTLAKSEALSLDPPRAGRLVNGLPPRAPVLDATELLARLPGAFRYDLGGVGWPHGLSLQGRPPVQTALTLDGRPFDDLLTGRPRYDLLPLPFLDTLRTQASGGPLGTPSAVRAALRPYDYARPLTTLRYRSGGFQSIGALHTQQRKVRFFGAPAFAQFTGGYFGRGADNTDVPLLPGSELRTERRLLGRVRYRRRGWSAQVTALYNRRRIGANGGVVLDEGQPPAIAFSPQQRTVRFPNAHRRLRRLDLSATLRLRDLTEGFSHGSNAPPDSLSEEVLPLTATAYRTRQTHRYRNPDLAEALGVGTTRPPPFLATFDADSLDAETVRYGVRLGTRLDLHSARFGRHALALNAHAWHDAFTGGNALPNDAARMRLHLSARDSMHLAGLDAVLNAGLHTGARQTYPSAGVRLEHTMARDSLGNGVRLFAEARLAGQPVSWIADEGFGQLVRPLPEGQAPGRVLSAEVGGRARFGSVETRFSVFAHRTTDRLALYATDTLATAHAALAEGSFQRAGATLTGRWRTRAERGFYATASATASLHRSSGPLAQRVAEALPQAHGQARLGARYAFFTDDLALDAYVEGRFWSPMAGRTPHSPTGRLVLPPPGNPTLGPAGTLDLHAEAQIRTATLFFSYENALAGTQVQRGVLGASVYPLPAQRFRFGVYWPIFN